MAENFDALFNRYLSMSKLLIQYLGTSEKLLAKKWIIFGSKLPRESGSVPGETRFKFAKHLFQVIKDDVFAHTLESEKGKKMSDEEKDKFWDEIQSLGETNDFNLGMLNQVEVETESTNCMSMWSPDKRTYISTKPMPGQGALVYLAVAERPDLGWDLPQSGTIK